MSHPTLSARGAKNSAAEEVATANALMSTSAAIRVMVTPTTRGAMRMDRTAMSPKSEIASYAAAARAAPSSITARRRGGWTGRRSSQGSGVRSGVGPRSASARPHRTCALLAERASEQRSRSRSDRTSCERTDRGSAPACLCRAKRKRSPRRTSDPVLVRGRHPSRADRDACFALVECHRALLHPG